MIAWILAAVVVVMTIATAALWWVTKRLANTEKSAIYNIADATDFVSERLPTILQGQLSYDDVETVLLWHLDYLRGQGFVTYGESDLEAQNAALGGSDVIATEEQAVDALLDRSRASGRDFDELQVVAIVDLNGDYMETIGALGQRRILKRNPEVTE